MMDAIASESPPIWRDKIYALPAAGIAANSTATFAGKPEEPNKYNNATVITGMINNFKTIE